MNVYVQFLAPGFELWAAAGGKRDVPVIEAVIELGEIAALVRTAALGAGQRALRDQAHQRMRVVGKRSQSIAVSFETGELPECLTALG